MGQKEYKRDKRSPIPKSSTVSKIMSSIKGKNTKPEIALRKHLYESNIRGYRVNYAKLPGKPDIVFTKKKVAIFVNGCYWHGCEVCGWKIPKHNPDYWISKIKKTRLRDEVKKKKLEELGYTVIVVWEHEIKKNFNDIILKIQKTLS